MLGGKVLVQKMAQFHDDDHDQKRGYNDQVNEKDDEDSNNNNSSKLKKTGCMTTHGPFLQKKKTAPVQKEHIRMALRLLEKKIVMMMANDRMGNGE